MAFRDAKRQGINGYVVYDRTMDGLVLRRHAVETRLREAVDTDALEVVHQPRVAAENGRITGFEALVRWTDPTFGVVTPEQRDLLAEAGCDER